MNVCGDFKGAENCYILLTSATFSLLNNIEHRPAEKSYESQYIGFSIIITEMYFHNKNLQF